MGRSALSRGSAVIALAVVISACGSSSPARMGAPAASTTPGTSTSPPAAVRCQPGQVKVTAVNRVSPMTGEHGFLVIVTNEGSSPCTLAGFPSVVLSDGSGPLPFTYRDGGGMYLAFLSASPMTLPASHRPSGAFFVAKYRCDLGQLRTATFAYFRLPISQHVVETVRLPLVGLSAGVTDMSLCKGGPRDPGQTVYVSTVQPLNFPPPYDETITSRDVIG